MKNKKAVLIMGAFNPITNAHLALGTACAASIKDADIYYIPSNSDYIKDWKGLMDNMIPDSDRIQLTAQAVSSSGFRVNDIEIKKIVNGRTYNTVSYFKNELGYESIYICCGYDKLDELHLWYRADELIAQNYFLIVQRDGKTINDCLDPFVLQYRDRFLALDSKKEYQNISSTKVREAYQNNRLESIKQYVPAVVYEYLCQKESTLWEK